jgi:hypothetical protein
MGTTGAPYGDGRLVLVTFRFQAGSAGDMQRGLGSGFGSRMTAMAAESAGLFSSMFHVQIPFLVETCRYSTKNCPSQR